MRTFETMKTPPTRELADVQPRARLAHNPVKSHTHVQHFLCQARAGLVGVAEGAWQLAGGAAGLRVGCWV